MVESVKHLNNLNLSEALKNGRLQDFIAEQEALKTAPVNKDVFNKFVKAAITEPPQPSQTSGSRARGGSRGK